MPTGLTDLKKHFAYIATGADTVPASTASGLTATVDANDSKNIQVTGLTQTVVETILYVFNAATGQVAKVKGFNYGILGATTCTFILDAEVSPAGSTFSFRYLTPISQTVTFSVMAIAAGGVTSITLNGVSMAAGDVRSYQYGGGSLQAPIVFNVTTGTLLVTDANIGTGLASSGGGGGCANYNTPSATSYAVGATPTLAANTYNSVSIAWFGVGTITVGAGSAVATVYGSVQNYQASTTLNLAISLTVTSGYVIVTTMS
jgi:azurin